MLGKEYRQPRAGPKTPTSSITADSAIHPKPRPPNSKGKRTPSSFCFAKSWMKLVGYLISSLSIFRNIEGGIVLTASRTLYLIFFSFSVSKASSIRISPLLAISIKCTAFCMY